MPMIRRKILNHDSQGERVLLPFRLKTAYLRASAIALVIAALGLSSIAKANIGESYGFGSRTAALGGAGVSYGYGGYAAYHNPAGLPFTGDKRLLIEAGALLMVPSFIPITNVVVENAYTSDKVTFSDVENDYRSTFGQELGLVYRLFPDAMNFTFGVAAFLPLQQVAYMDTGETFVPEYMLYRSRTQRPQVEVGFGGDLGHGIHVGVGFHLAFALTSSATVFLQTDSAKPSTMRFASSLKPKVAPVFGVLFTPPSYDTDSSTPPVYTVGAVLRLPVSSPNSLFLKSGARAFGSFAALDFNFNALSTLFYDPLTIELGGTIQETPNARLYLQADYQAWSKFEAPALLILDPKNESCGNSPCGVNISGGKNPIFTYKDIIIPRVAEEITVGANTYRVGYAFRPSILSGLPTGAGNYLDPPKHIFTAGYGRTFDHFLSYHTPCNLDFHVSYEQLLTQHVSKDPGDENGNGVGDLKIGAPGYDAGGKIYGGGVSLTLAF
jgi:hypothetical protein